MEFLLFFGYIFISIFVLDFLVEWEDVFFNFKFNGMICLKVSCFGLE